MSNLHEHELTPSERDRRMLELVCRVFYEKRYGGTSADLRTVKFIRSRGPQMIFRTKAGSILYLKCSEYLAAKQLLLASPN